MNMQRFFTVILMGGLVVGAEAMKLPPKDKEEASEVANKDQQTSHLPRIGSIPVRPFNTNLATEQNSSFSQTKRPLAQNHDHESENIFASFEADFNETMIQEAQNIYQFAPPLAKEILMHLTDERSFILNPEYRVAFFWGPPGCGKTMTAKHIGITLQKEHGWKFLFIPSARTAQDKRNATAQSLNALFTKILKDKVNKYYLAFDEINELFEHTRSEHHDTNITSKVTRGFLDELLGNPKVFCVGTLNVIDQLEEAAKDRYFEYTIRFSPTIGNVIRNACFRSKVTTAISKLDEQINDDQLDTLLKGIDHGGRQLSGIAFLCKQLCRIENPDVPMLIITNKLISQAVKESLLIRTEGKYGQPEETEKEQQERHFEKSYNQHADLATAQRNQQAAQFREAQESQAKLAELNFGTQVTIAARSYAQNIKYGDDYDANIYINRLYHYYYRMFPQRRPRDYQRLPQSIHEDPQQDSCCLQ